METSRKRRPKVRRSLGAASLGPFLKKWVSATHRILATFKLIESDFLWAESDRLTGGCDHPRRFRPYSRVTEASSLGLTSLLGAVASFPLKPANYPLLTLRRFSAKRKNERANITT